MLSDGFRKPFFRKTAPLRYLRNQMHPDGYSMPMRKGEIAVLFNGMSQGMPQIQQLPQTCIEFILIDDIPFHFYAGFNDFLQLFPKITRCRFRKQLRIPDYAVFQRFGNAVRENFFRQVSKVSTSQSTSCG